MRLSLNWLREFVRLPEDGKTLARLLTEHAFETTVLPSAPRATLETITVGEVQAVAKHPQADRLTVTRVKTAKGTRTIVCGAPNVRVGLHGAVALPGAKLVSTEGTLETLAASTIRGVTSEGMLCSDQELGLGSDHGGILELPVDTKVGMSLATLFPEDVLLDADVLPDRAADCSSHLGVARELGAILKRTVKFPRVTLPPARGKAPEFRVSVEDARLCPRYLAVVLDGIRREPSPAWMQARLLALGVRPQHLVVDVTNYVLWEVGQPTHAFDARAIGRSLGVRRTRVGERLVTLDGMERTLPEGVLVITSDNRPIALAGIMGGSESGVGSDTTRIILEVALFDRGLIRETTGALGLRTDASDRFSKGLTTAHVAAGAARVVELLTKLGGAHVVAVKDLFPRKEKPISVTVSQREIEGVLGMPVQATAVRRTLKSLGYHLTEARSTYRVTPPLFRTDVSIAEDVVEDVGRMVGYNRLPVPLPSAPMVPAALPLELQDVRRVQDTLKGAGWTETYTYSFMQEEEALALGLHKVENLQVVNPVSRDHVRLRTSLLPNLLHLAWSAVKKEPLFRVFEIGHTYPAKGPEQTHVAGFLIRRGKEPHAADFYEIKGVVEHILQTLGVPDVWFDPTEPTPQDVFLFVWEKGQSAEVKSGEEELGFVGAISTDVLSRFRIQGTIVAFELNLTRIYELERATLVYNPPLPYPTIQRDLSLRVPEGVLVDEIMEAIAGVGGALVQDVDFVDLYDPFETSQGRPELASKGDDPSGAQKGVTVRITYGSLDRTLRDDEVNTLHRQIIAKITEDLGVEERT